MIKIRLMKVYDNSAAMVEITGNDYKIKTVAELTETEIDDVFILKTPTDAIKANAEITMQGLKIPGMDKATTGHSMLENMDEKMLAAMFSNTGGGEVIPGIQEFKPEDANIESIAEKIVQAEKAKMEIKTDGTIIAPSNQIPKSKIEIPREILWRIPLEEQPIEGEQ